MSRILFFLPHPKEDAGYRYRVQQFTPYLRAAGYVCRIAPFSTSQLYASLRSRGALPQKIAHTVYCSARRVAQLARLSEFDLIVIQREVFPFFAPMMERFVLLRHPRVIFSFDDAIYAGHGDLAPLNHPTLYRFKYGRGVDYVVRNSWHVIAGN